MCLVPPQTANNLTQSTNTIFLCLQNTITFLYTKSRHKAVLLSVINTGTSNSAFINTPFLLINHPFQLINPYLSIRKCKPNRSLKNAWNFLWDIFSLHTFNSCKWVNIISNRQSLHNNFKPIYSSSHLILYILKFIMTTSPFI